MLLFEMEGNDGSNM